MKFRNPHYVAPESVAAAALAPKITAYLQTRTGAEYVGLARLKADVPEAAAATRQVLNIALGLIGAAVDLDGVDNA